MSSTWRPSTTAAAWITPQLHRVGYSQSFGAVVTAGFWLSLAIGRFLAGPVHRHVSDQRLVIIGLAATVPLALAATVDSLAPAAYPLVGLGLALVYPMGLIWFTNLNPGDGDGLAILVLTMMAGGVIGPALTGAAVSVAGVRAVPVCVACLAAADLAVFFVARQYEPPISAHGPVGVRPRALCQFVPGGRVDRFCLLSPLERHIERAVELADRDEPNWSSTRLMSTGPETSDAHRGQCAFGRRRLLGGPSPSAAKKRPEMLSASLRTNLEAVRSRRPGTGHRPSLSMCRAWSCLRPSLSR